MPIRNYPFSVIRPGDIARPYLPVTIVNPNTQNQINAYSLIDTGADECAFPASFAPLLGHNLQAGQLKRISTGNGVTIAYKKKANKPKKPGRGFYAFTLLRNRRFVLYLNIANEHRRSKCQN